MADAQTTTEPTANLTELVADIVGAYVSKNSIQVADLPKLISEVHSALRRTANGEQETQAESQKPAVPIKRSVTPDYIISLESGRKMKSLKRYLRTSYGMTPDEYRAKWGLPRDYPMVAPNYAAARSELAKKSGLGRKAAAAKAAIEPKRRGGRTRKTAAE